MAAAAEGVEAVEGGEVGHFRTLRGGRMVSWGVKTKVHGRVPRRLWQPRPSPSPAPP